MWTLTAVNHTQFPSCLARSLVAIVEKVSPASSCTRREQTSEPIYWKEDHDRAYKKAQTTLKWATTPLSDSNISTVLHHIHPTALMTSFRYKSKTNFRSKRKKKILLTYPNRFLNKPDCFRYQVTTSANGFDWKQVRALIHSSTFAQQKAVNTLERAMIIRKTSGRISFNKKLK